ncbi:DUF2232 domain-containing protein [Hydrogenovibrio sp. JE_KL2]|uniref:DUF2232 domain-containing protein n=1 Tax=Hydrogenovibrio sp. JE_KL2 TaxID=2651188 RepID=UPI00128E190B|nr:DUF2232 domain-containing protein [Hydrogenovibrio sp. JE_KL2]MPQ75756.1 DUF2232 domain-containing protein [Hydrogenovibrio sp. JE_KL2]
MLFIANYVMKGQLPAYIATAILALLTVWFGPVGMLLGAVIALVTLRVGSGEGLKVLTAAVAINLVATQAFLGASLPAIVSIAEYMVPVWLMAWVLRSTNSLASALSLGMLMTGAVVIAFHMMVGDTTAWWSNMMNTALLPYVKEAGVAAPADLIATMSEVATMLLAMFMVVLWFSILLLGRWWQGRLYHPGQFQQDFYQVRLPKNLAYLAVVLAIAGLVFKSGMVQDLSGVMMAGLMFPGLAIAHHAVAVKKMGSGWLVGLYVLLFLFPQTILILATIGLIDTWLDIRSRWSQDS